MSVVELLSNPMFVGAAQYWRGFEWSVIPIEPKGKRPLVKWEEYQDSLCEEHVLGDWWTKWPNANVGVVTGKVSGITVVDIDNADGMRAIAKYIEGLTVPSARTQKGGRHLYFKYVPGIGNKVRVLPGVDVRNDGGFVVAPPSEGTEGKYEWEPGHVLGLVTPPEMPEGLKMVLRAIPATVEGAPPRPGPRVASPEDFKEGHRNDTIFHYAVSLAKGGVRDEGTLMTMLRPINAALQPPLPEREMVVAIKSAVAHAEKKERNWSADIKGFLEFVEAEFDIKTLYTELDAKDPVGMNAIRQAVKRLVDTRVVEPVGRGWYRKVDRDAQAIEFLTASVQPLDFTLPLDVHSYINIYPGNILVIAGEQNVGKTGYLLETVRLNMDRHRIRYFSSEMGASELKVRLDLYDDIKTKDWNFKAFERGAQFQDVIEPGEVNIIDFLEVTDEFWKVGTYLAKIHERLGGTGLAIVALQKGKNKDFGRGGDMGLEKPRLYLTLSRQQDMQGAVAQMVKAKNWKTTVNPNGMLRPFHCIMGHKFTSSYPWMSIAEFDAIFGTENGKPKTKGDKKF